MLLNTIGKLKSNNFWRKIKAGFSFTQKWLNTIKIVETSTNNNTKIYVQSYFLQFVHGYMDTDRAIDYKFTILKKL